MKSESRKQYFVGMILAVAVLIFFFAAFYILSVTDKTGLNLMDTASERYGWEYEFLLDGRVTAFEPEFEDEYTLTLPDESAEAVRITRTMTEKMDLPDIEFTAYRSGVEVFLDDCLLYSDFQGGQRSAEGFLLLDETMTEPLREKIEKSEWGKKVRISLPEDYLGKKLMMTTYFLEGMEDDFVIFPFLKNGMTDYAGPVTDTVVPAAGLTLCMVLGVLIPVIFVMDIQNGSADPRAFLLCLYFILLFLNNACSSLPGSCSNFTDIVNRTMLVVPARLFAAPLYLYLALRLTGWRKYFLTGCTAAWFLCEGIWICRNYEQISYIVLYRDGLAAFLLLLAVMVSLAAESVSNRKKRWGKKEFLSYIVLGAAVSTVCILYDSRELEGDVAVYLVRMAEAMADGWFIPFVHLVTNICSVMAVVILILGFIRRTVESRTMIQILEERERLTLEDYGRMLKTREATSQMRHEMTHHMTALMGILKNGETERACGYISSVVSELAELPVSVYSRNVLVNTIAGAYLERAKAEGIRVEYSLSLPEDLQIEDRDISVLLTNMLQNALEACGRMTPEADRYIKLKIHKNGNFLFVGCVNSTAAPQEEAAFYEKRTEQESGRHGYGLAAMRVIAEKYSSVLKIDRDPQEFSVRTNLYVKSRKG